MPRQPEGKLVAKMRTLILQRGGRPFKIQGSDETFQEVGIPDLLVCYKGWFLGLEAKLPGAENTLSPKQAAVLKSIDQAGGLAAVVTTVDAVRELLDEIDKLEDA